MERFKWIPAAAPSAAEQVAGWPPLWRVCGACFGTAGTAHHPAEFQVLLPELFRRLYARSDLYRNKSRRFAVGKWLSPGESGRALPAFFAEKWWPQMAMASARVPGAALETTGATDVHSREESK